MMTSFLYKNITWVDVQSPDRDEIERLSKTYDLDPRIAHEIFTPSPIGEARHFDEVVFAVFHFPVCKQTHSSKDEHTQEINFIIGENFIITVRYDTVDSLHRFSRKLEVDAITRSAPKDKIDGMQMFYSMILEFHRSTVEELRHLNDQINTIQKHLNQSDEKKIIVDISNMAQTLLDFQNALMMHKDTYERLSDMVEEAFGNHGYRLLMDIRKNHHKISDEIDHYRHVSTELRETHLSLLNARQNEIMKNLTVLAFLTFPITVIAALFSMTETNTPIVGHPYDFWIIASFMAVFMFFALLYFWYKRWL